MIRCNKPTDLFENRAQRPLTILVAVPFIFAVGLLWLVETGSAAPDGNDLLLRFPKQWQFLIPQESVLLTNDRQLEALQDPDRRIEISEDNESRQQSLREICEAAKRKGSNTIVLAFDNFYRPFRSQGEDERRLLSDSEEYLRKIKKISDFVALYGLGLELSLLSPLELGSSFIRLTKDAGRWVHYKVDLRDPRTGQFSVPLWEHLAWSNNKGKFGIRRTGVRAFAFKEQEFAGGRYVAVNPDDIKEITSGIKIEEWLGTESPPERSFRSRRIRIYHEGDENLKGYDRVLVLLIYETPEMDYFSPDAPPFLRQLVGKYHQEGIRLNGLYSDEMHIQQDWSYFAHHDNGQFALRYVTKNMARTYGKLYGAGYEDMDRYLLYFVFGPRIFLNTTDASLNSQYVMGTSPEDVHKTFLFRHRYYRLLNNGVVNLFLDAKKYAEELYGKKLPNRAHASWAQSPTIDRWNSDGEPHAGCRYEYTPGFVWSNTVHQAASACYDYFKWGEFLAGTGNDFAEAGWADRNYYGLAMACSIGIQNEYPNAYSYHCCMPDKAAERRMAVTSAFGADATPTIKAITENVHRDVDVLMLYPMSLVAAEERFGSWMTQYGYANYITAEKLLELGKVTETGTTDLAGRSFSTVVALFEILPNRELLEMMDRFASRGGRVIWSGPPPLLCSDGRPCLKEWEDLFQVVFSPPEHHGEMAAGKLVDFQNSLQNITAQVILTDFIVDRVYPVKPSSQVEVVATVDGKVVGTKCAKNRGALYFLGFRPRDDQSRSLGKEQRTWFEILNAIGAYQSSGKFPGTNDSTEYVSRTTDLLATRFPNGATVLAAHYRTHRETWSGNFARNGEEDARVLQENPLPSDRINVSYLKVNGHEVSFDGRLIMAFNTDDRGNLTAFECHDCNQVTLDDKHYRLSDSKQKLIAWAPVCLDRKIQNGAFLQVYIDGSGEIRIPFNTTARRNLQLFAEGDIPGSKGSRVPFVLDKGMLIIAGNAQNTNRWLYLVGDED